jgi:phage shock protein E
MKYISRIIYFLVLFGVIGAVIYYVFSYTTGSPYKVSTEVANILLRTNKIDVILDVRTKQEKETLGGYPGAVNIPVSELQQQFPRNYPNKNNLILLYCNTGQRARYATDLLHSLGYNNSFYIVSGPSTLTKQSP